jgi:hypothetical protein
VGDSENNTFWTNLGKDIVVTGAGESFIRCDLGKDLIIVSYDIQKVNILGFDCEEDSLNLSLMLFQY